MSNVVPYIFGESMSFWDKYGLLHVQPNVPSENGILFASEFYALERVHNHPIYEGENALLATQIDLVTYQANPPQMGEHFSHDNMTGYKCLHYNLYGNDGLTPILKWNNRWWLHPRDIIFYLILRLEGLCGFLLLLLLLPFLLFSLMSVRGNTSGKCLWFLRLVTLSMSQCPWLSTLSTLYILISNLILTFRHGPEPWIDIFKIYFANPMHPIHEQIREIYE